jgi:hypothetical protein
MKVKFFGQNGANYTKWDHWIIGYWQPEFRTPVKLPILQWRL